jgi:hypothetical protein
VLGLQDNFQKRLRSMVTGGQLSDQDAAQLAQKYESAASWTTYLD